MKNVFCFVLVFLMLINADLFAQSQGWHLSAGVGPQVYFGKNDHKMKFGDRVMPSFNVSLGKQITPVVGLDLSVNAARFKGVYVQSVQGQNFRTDCQYVNPSYPEDLLYEQKGTYMNMYVRCIFNFTGMFRGADVEYRHNFLPYIGGGWAHGFDCDGNAEAGTVNFGVMYDYRFSGSFSLNVDMRGAFIGRQFDGEECSRHLMHMYSGLSIGVAYYFGK